MPEGPQGQKRPADPIAASVHVARIATGETRETVLDAASTARRIRRLRKLWQEWLRDSVEKRNRLIVNLDPLNSDAVINTQIAAAGKHARDAMILAGMLERLRGGDDETLVADAVDACKRLGHEMQETEDGPGARMLYGDMLVALLDALLYEAESEPA